MRLIRRKDRSNGGALAPWRGESRSSWNELDRIRNEIDRIFEDPFSLATPSTGFFEGWTPNVDVYEDKDKITVKAELPGMRKEDIHINVTGNTLTISGERKHEERKKEGETFREERFFGRFQRSITLPTAVDTTKIQATYKDGVLTIECPKAEEAKPKQIEVKAQ